MGEQLTGVVTLVRDIFGDELAGAYLFGSATAGGLKPTSDIDVLGVLRRRSTAEERRRLVDALLELSLQPRYLEVTLVVASEVRPWRYPPRMDLQYGDWWRDELGRGEEPWPEENPDLAVLLTMVLQSGRTLHGPPAAELLDPVPLEDVLRAAADGLDEVLGEVPHDTRNKLLTLARMWCTRETGEIRSKDEAAAWAVAQRPSEALARARTLYLAGDYGEWDDLDVMAEAERVAERIRANPTRLLGT
ncbi:MAG: aminoglycoside adenylyltransferase domain-containing protein [Gaiellaceae bacterium]